MYITTGICPKLTTRIDNLEGEVKMEELKELLGGLEIAMGLKYSTGDIMNTYRDELILKYDEKPREIEFAVLDDNKRSIMERAVLLPMRRSGRLDTKH